MKFHTAVRILETHDEIDYGVTIQHDPARVVEDAAIQRFLDRNSNDTRDTIDVKSRPIYPGVPGLYTDIKSRQSNNYQRTVGWANHVDERKAFRYIKNKYPDWSTPSRSQGTHAMEQGSEKYDRHAAYTLYQASILPRPTYNQLASQQLLNRNGVVEVESEIRESTDIDYTVEPAWIRWIKRYKPGVTRVKQNPVPGTNATIVSWTTPWSVGSALMWPDQTSADRDFTLTPGSPMFKGTIDDVVTGTKPVFYSIGVLPRSVVDPAWHESSAFPWFNLETQTEEPVDPEE